MTMSVTGSITKSAAAAPERREHVSLTAWVAGAAAVVALVVLVWVVLSGQGAGGDEQGGSSGPRRAATVGAVPAVALAPELDPGPAGMLGGPGSAVVDGPVLTVADSSDLATRRPSRPRRARRPRSDQTEPSRPAYRTIGPSADEAAAPRPEPSGA